MKSAMFRCGTEEGRAACLTLGTNTSGTEQKASGRDWLAPLLVERSSGRPGSPSFVQVWLLARAHPGPRGTPNPGVAMRNNTA